MTTLVDAYSAALRRGDIQDDGEQRRLLMPLQNLTDQLLVRQAWYRCLLPQKSIQGLYITGPVGGGKTYMMDMFYQNLPGNRKLRVHFLHFMQKIDQKLRFLQGHRDPLLKIAAELAKQYTVICIDEFIVDDMAYAMILGELLQALFSRHVILVATSNTKIEDLYRNGMNRERFLPAIALLHRYCSEINILSSVDYRLGRDLHLHAYFYPLNTENERALGEQFKMLACDVSVGGSITVQSRPISVVKVSQSVIWFEFATICAMPRCQLDYIELAERYHTIFVAHVPILDGENTSTAVILLIQLVDVLYDRGIRLIISAASALTDLYRTGPMKQEFSRTLSRLEEMQSEDYLARHCTL